MNDRKNDLKLDTLYPDMPASFSNRIDDVLNEVRSGRVRRRGRRHAVAVACACAAAFVVICGTALLLPALQQETRREESVICPLAPVEPVGDERLSEIETALLVQLQVAEGDRFVLTELSAVRQGQEYLARAGYLLYHDGAAEPYAQERAEITLTETAEGLRVSHTQVILHEQLLPMPTPTLDPLATPSVLPYTTPQAPTTVQEFPVEELDEATVERMARVRATALMEEYYAVLREGGQLAADPLTEFNDETALWYCELELEHLLVEMGYAEPVEGDMLHDVRVTSVANGAYGYVNAGCEATTVFEDGNSRTVAFVLTLDPLQDYRIVGIARQDETSMTAALQARVALYVAGGMTRADAGAAALEELREQLRDMATIAWDGEAGELLWNGQRQSLPMRSASGQAWQTVWQTAWQTPEGGMSSLALLESGVVPMLSVEVLAQLEDEAGWVIGGTVVQDSFQLWRYNGTILTEVCTGTPGTLVAQLAEMPAGPYLVTFSFRPDTPVAEEVAASPAPAETPAPHAVPVTSAVQFAFVVSP